MKQAIHTNDHTNTRGKQRRWRRYLGYALVPIGIGAFFLSCMHSAIGYDAIEHNPCDCEPVEFIDSRGVPYYYDTPVGWPIQDETIGSDTAQEIYEWAYIDPPCDNHLPEEADEFLPAKQKGGVVMDP